LTLHQQPNKPGAMLDDVLRRRSEPLLAPLVRRVAGVRIRADALTASVAILNALAVFDIAHRLYLPALAILVAGRVLDALDGPVARLQGITPAGAVLDRVLDLTFLGALAFAFGLAEPDRALAAMFLMLGLVARAGVPKSFIGKTEVYAAFALACVFPAWFSLIAYAAGILCFVGAGLGLANLFASRTV
jgi:phosphatidylglycerophosphate synthase